MDWVASDTTCSIPRQDFALPRLHTCRPGAQETTTDSCAVWSRPLWKQHLLPSGMHVPLSC